MNRSITGGDRADANWTAQYAGVGAHSASGRLLRRYWHPVLLSSEIPPRMLRSIQLLGEELVVFRLADGRLGVMPEHCRHRGASLAYGFVDADGIRCAYHGWKYSPTGELLETPFGGPIGRQHEAVAQIRTCKAYECGGIVFVCLDPENDISGLPNWDLLMTGADELVVQRHTVDCNWFQYQENAADVTHTLFLHGVRLRSLGIPDASGFHAPFVWYAFAEVPFGLVKAWLYEGRRVGWGNIAVFPTMLRIVQEMQWRVPLTLEKTLIFQVSGRQLGTGPTARASDLAVRKEPLAAVSIEDPPVHRDDSSARYRLWSFQGQDAAACASQGKIASREREHLSTSDLGIMMYRRLWKELCDANLGPSKVYSSLHAHGAMLDLRPWLSSTDIAVSRPVVAAVDSRSKRWQEIFRGNESLIPVPRGAAGRGPLG